MKTITITSKAEWEALPESFEEFTYIEIVSNETIKIRKNPENSKAVLHGNSKAVLRENSKAWLYDNSEAWLYDNSEAELYGNSRAELYGNSKAVLYGNSKAWLYENSEAVLHDNSEAVLHDNSKAVLYDNSEAVLHDNSRGYIYSEKTSEVFDNAKAFLMRDNTNAVSKSETAKVIPPTWTAEGFCEREGVEIKDGKCVLFKRVSKDFKTQEETPNETVWKIGTTLTVPNWNPEGKECGEGKFHACGRPWRCDEFRDTKGDRYIAIEVEIEDMFAWKEPFHLHKIAFRKGKVLFECDRERKRVES